MASAVISCDSCGASARGRPPEACSGCPGTFTVDYPPAEVKLPGTARSMWDYADLLPVERPDAIVSLGEGATPLVASRARPGERLFWKLESANPTGSQKDRALSVAVSKANELGAEKIIIASTGSAGVSCAAYAARAGLPCIVLVPHGTQPNRLLAMQGLGAVIVELQGTFVQIERMLDMVRRDGGWFDATTKRAANPFHVEGPKTIAYELVEEMGAVPDWVVVPVGGGATLYGMWRGFKDLRRLGRIDRLPRLAAVQPSNFNSLESALGRGLGTLEELEALGLDEGQTTVMHNLKHGVPPDALDALVALRESGGVAISVTDIEALSWQRRLGATDGVLAEPSSAAAAAGVDQMMRSGAIRPGETVVGLITGSALRDMRGYGDLRLNRLPDTATTSELDDLVHRRQQELVA